MGRRNREASKAIPRMEPLTVGPLVVGPLVVEPLRTLIMNRLEKLLSFLNKVIILQNFITLKNYEIAQTS